RRHNVPRLRREFRGTHVAALDETIDLDRLEIRIDDPVLFHAGSLVQPPFEHFITTTARRRQHLDREIGRAARVLLADYRLESLRREVDQIRFDHVVLREHDVEGSQHHDAGRIRAEILTQQYVQITDNELMRRAGRTRHEVLPVYQLVPQTVV